MVEIMEGIRVLKTASISVGLHQLRMSSCEMSGSPGGQAAASKESWYCRISGEKGGKSAESTG